MKNIIFDAGLAYSFKEFENLFNESRFFVHYIGESEFCNQMSSNIVSSNVDYTSYEQLYAYQSYNLEYDELTNLHEVIDFVTRDKLTEELYDRTMSNFIFNYSTKNEVKITKMTIAAYKFVLANKPSFMLLYECSHNIRTWVIGRVCEALGIPVRYGRNGIFHWRNVFLEGMNKYPKLVDCCKCIDGFTEWEYQMFKEIASRYEKGTEAIKPEYLQVMKDKKMKKLYSLKKDLKDDWKRLDRVAYKYYCYKKYENLCTTQIPEKFIVFYLHLQPERTTLPEGYGFTQQYKALSLLNEVIPSDWKIVVKEHPATFYRYCTPSGRWPQLYKDMASLSKVILVPLETDTYMLIERSKCVATIAGTVCREALMMGKPALLFGINAFFGNMPKGLYNYESLRGLKDFVSTLEEYDQNEIKAGFDKYIHESFLQEGAVGITEDTEWKNNSACIITANKVSRYKLIHRILTIEE